MRQSQEWKDRAGVALDAGNLGLAKKALAKKAESDKQVASMQVAVDQAKASSEKLKQQDTALKGKIDEGERTATTLVARKNAASAQRKVAEAIIRAWATPITPSRSSTGSKIRFEEGGYRQGVR